VKRIGRAEKDVDSLESASTTDVSIWRPGTVQYFLNRRPFSSCEGTNPIFLIIWVRDLSPVVAGTAWPVFGCMQRNHAHEQAEEPDDRISRRKDAGEDHQKQYLGIN
jgi:hypothetical protein